MFFSQNKVLRYFKNTFLASAFFALFCLPNICFSYGFETHGYLTKELVKFFNQKNPEINLDQELESFLIDGSRKEDDSPRWINHFFDPVNNRGYQPEVNIDSYPLAFAKTLEKVVQWVNSKEWAQSSNEQNRLVYAVSKDIYPVASILSAQDQENLDFSETNYSWEQAKNWWLKGEKEKAMFALGHVLHLIEDASVPDHTRNDGHISDSPYETWTSKFNLSNQDSELESRLIQKEIIKFNSLDDYFKSLADYSNNNFYSADTIGIQSGYENPNFDYVGKDGKFFYAFKKDLESRNDYKLFIYKNYKGSLVLEFKDDLVLYVKNAESGDLVMRDYWSRLSTKAIQHGAGVLELFFKEVANSEITEIPAPWYQKLWVWLFEREPDLTGQILPPANGLDKKDLVPSFIPSPLISGILESQGRVLGEQAPRDGSTGLPQDDFPFTNTAPLPFQSPLISNNPEPPNPPVITQSNFPPVMFAQTPNNPVFESLPRGEQSVHNLPEPSLSPEPSPTILPTPSPDLSPEPTLDPSPEPTIEPSPEPTSKPRINYQASQNEYFDQVAWYFDKDLYPELGGIFSIEFELKKFLPLNDYHAILVGWNTDLTHVVGSKYDGNDKLVLKYALENQTGYILNELDPSFGVVDSLFAWRGEFENASSSFPMKLKIQPTLIRSPWYQLIQKDQLEGITRQALENKLGRQIGRNDFISLGYWPVETNSTPPSDLTRYSASFLENISDPVVFPSPYPIPQLKQLRWGIDSESYSGYSLEFEYAWPLNEVYNPSAQGFELKFHLNGAADFYQTYDGNLARMWFSGSNQPNFIYLNNGNGGSDTCSLGYSSEPKSAMRFLPSYCDGNSYKQVAYNFDRLPHIQNPASSSWILKLPILSAPKDLSSLTTSDYLTVSLWAKETSPADGIFLRQVDQRLFFFEAEYRGLVLGGVSE